MLTAQTRQAQTQSAPSSAFASASEAGEPTPSPFELSSSVLRFLEGRLEAETEAFAKLTAAHAEALLERTSAARASEEAEAAWTTEPSADAWKRVTKAREAQSQADVRARTLGRLRHEALEDLSRRQREALLEVRAELRRKASGVGLPLGELRGELEALLSQASVFAKKAQQLVTERNAAEARVWEIARYLGDERELRGSPMPAENAEGWAVKAGCGSHTDATVASVVVALLRELGHGARGAHGSPLRRFLQALDHAHEPPPKPVVEEVCP